MTFEELTSKLQEPFSKSNTVTAEKLALMLATTAVMCQGRVTEAITQTIALMTAANRAGQNIEMFADAIVLLEGKGK